MSKKTKITDNSNSLDSEEEIIKLDRSKKSLKNKSKNKTKKSNKKHDKKAKKSNKSNNKNNNKNNKNTNSLNEDSNSILSLETKMLTGQKAATPSKGDPLRLFYESMLKQKPESILALKYCVEHGCLNEAEAELGLKKLQKLIKKN